MHCHRTIYKPFSLINLSSLYVACFKMCSVCTSKHGWIYKNRHPPPPSPETNIKTTSPTQTGLYRRTPSWFTEYPLTWTTHPILWFLLSPQRQGNSTGIKHKKQSTSPTLPLISVRWWLHYWPARAGLTPALCPNRRLPTGSSQMHFKTIRPFLYFKADSFSESTQRTDAFVWGVLSNQTRRTHFRPMTCARRLCPQLPGSEESPPLPVWDSYLHLMLRVALTDWQYLGCIQNRVQTLDPARRGEKARWIGHEPLDEQRSLEVGHLRCLLFERVVLIFVQTGFDDTYWTEHSKKDGNQEAA